MSRWTRAAAAVALLASLGAACGSGAERAITIYSGRSEELVGPLLEDFERSSGIDVQVRYGDTAELASTIDEEGDRSPADVFWAQDAGALGFLESRERFATLPSDVLALVPAQFRSRTGAWIGVTGRVRVLAFNPTLVKEPDLPDSVEGLTDPKWKGKIGWAPTNGSFQIFVTAFRKIEGEPAARAWLETMKANDAQEYKDNDSIAEAVAEGEIVAGLVNHYYPFEIRAEVPDAKIENHFFSGGDVGSLVNVSGVGILKSSADARRDAALELIRYLLSAEGQRYFVTKTFEYPLRPGQRADERLPAFAEVEAPDVDLTQLADLDGTLKLLREVELL